MYEIGSKKFKVSSSSKIVLVILDKFYDYGFSANEINFSGLRGGYTFPFTIIYTFLYEVLWVFVFYYFLF